VAIAVERDQIERVARPLQDRGGFTAGRGTGIEHPLARLGIEQLRGQLCAAILDRHPPRRKAGQIAHRTRLIELTPLSSPSMRCAEARRLQFG
jgi:hypothetical protein